MQGHLDQEQKNIRSTRHIQEDLVDIEPVQEPYNNKTNNTMCQIIAIDEICKNYSDQTEKIPSRPPKDKYILVFYH